MICVGLSGKNFNVEDYKETAQPNLFIPSVLICTIDFYNFIPFLWPWPCLGVARSAWGKTYELHFLPHFSTSQAEIWYDDEVI